LGLGFVFASDDGSAAIGVVMFVTKGLGFVVQLYKANKTNIIEHYVYDYQGNRARTVVESDHQAQSKRDYLPSLDIPIHQAKQQLLFGWMARVCCHVLLFAWCDRAVRLLPMS
jgi:hypothetical protein